jgi:hypothetical protein
MHSDLNQQVDIAKLLFVGGLVETIPKGRTAISHGRVYVQEWCISIGESTLPRWVLRGVTITCGRKSMQISDDGMKIIRNRVSELS